MKVAAQFQSSSCVLSRQAWLQQLSPCALQPGQPEREALVSADLQRLQAALVWELNHQYVNVKASKALG